jgi:hypothetical protein
MNCIIFFLLFLLNIECTNGFNVKTNRFENNYLKNLSAQKICKSQQLNLSKSTKRSDENHMHKEQKILSTLIFPIATVAILSVLFENSAHAASKAIANIAPEAGLIQSFLLIFVSELGDKTFFIAGLLAAKYGRLISFTGSIGALAVMTVISTTIGQVFHAVPTSFTQG